jgi:hypothetical protein
VCRHGAGPCKLPDTAWVRARDFFVLDEDSTIEINGGHPPIYVLNEGMLDDLLTESLPLASDASVAEGYSSWCTTSSQVTARTEAISSATSR